MTRSRGVIPLLIACGVLAWAQDQPKPQPRPQEPAEEDETVAKPEYTFNPLQAEKEMKVGEYYAKKGSWKAAANRFQEATKWNPGLAVAWLRLGDAENRLKHADAARAAWAKYVELAPDDKHAAELRKKLAKSKPPAH